MNELDHARELHRRGDLGAAIPAYRMALGRSPQDVMAWHDMAVALLQARQPDQALSALQRGLLVEPQRFELLLAMSQAQLALGQQDAALATADAATRAAPEQALSWLVRGRLEVVVGTSKAAEDSLRRALALAPDSAEAWHYLGETLQKQGRWDDAADAYRQAMREHPGEIMNVGLCAEQAGRWSVARDAYREMCRLFPQRRDCRARLALIEAMRCDFNGQTEATTALLAQLAHPAMPGDIVEPFACSVLEIPAALTRGVLHDAVQRVLRQSPKATSRPAQRPRAANAPIRIGYLSADFGQHAVGTLLQGLFAAHDRQRFQVICYSLKRHVDPVAQRLRAECDQFHDVDAMSSMQITEQIRADGIDVLIDLMGFTRGARPDILARRPAALQLGWLGFIHAHEAPWLDGLILDEGTQPSDAAWPWSDTVVRLPGFLFPSGPMPTGQSDRMRFGLPEDVPLLASFNNSYKIDATLLDAWVEILRRAENAHLAVYLPPEARDNFIRAWRERGGDLQRLHPMEHLAADAQADRAASCDLFLDAFRYQAGATAVACAAAGLPLLSRVGNTPLSRLGVSMNHFLGMDELVCADTADYIERAAALASDHARLAALRQRMRQAVSDRGLHDPRRAAAALERLIEQRMAIPTT